MILKPESLNRDWIAMTAMPEHVARERAKARELRASQWWKQRIASGVCHYCGKRFPPSELTMDHVVPVARGGKSEKSNVVPACHACNQEKRYLTPADQALASINRISQCEVLGDDGCAVGTLLYVGGHAVVINPSDSFAVQAKLSDLDAVLAVVFVTGDYANSAETCDVLHNEIGAQIVGPESCEMELDRIVVDGDVVSTPVADITVSIKDGVVSYLPQV